MSHLANPLNITPVLENINVIEIVIQSSDIIVNQDKLHGQTRILIRTPGAATLQFTASHLEFSGDVIHLSEVE